LKSRTALRSGFFIYLMRAAWLAMLVLSSKASVFAALRRDRALKRPQSGRCAFAGQRTIGLRRVNGYFFRRPAPSGTALGDGFFASAFAKAMAGQGAKNATNYSLLAPPI
jgi:hypothetical protein